ncbi:MAG: type II toxin-antitoxin system RelE/ParE family toxin [Oceanicaulis sp.]
MKGREGVFRLRVGDWRVLYRDGVVIAVIRIAPRGSAYE